MLLVEYIRIAAIGLKHTFCIAICALSYCKRYAFALRFAVFCKRSGFVMSTVFVGFVIQ